MSDELADQVEELIEEPAAATAPGRSAQNRGLKEVTDALDWAANQRAKSSNKLPIRLGPISPGGAP